MQKHNRAALVARTLVHFYSAKQRQFYYSFDYNHTLGILFSIFKDTLPM